MQHKKRKYFSHDFLNHPLNASKKDGKLPTLNETLEAPVTVTEKTETPVVGTTSVVEAVVVTKKKKVAEKTEKTEIEPTPEKKFLRPPLEILTQDFENYLTTLSIDKVPLQRLGYKCGKIIYGIPQLNPDGKKAKDLRVIAFKARKKSEKVEGKSRCIFYFGLTQPMPSSDLKLIPGAAISKFGKCSVQSKHPVEIILDKVTFTDIFNKDVEKVFNTLKFLSDLTIAQKSAIPPKTSKKTTKDS